MLFKRKQAAPAALQAVLTVLAGPKAMLAKSFRLGDAVTVIGRNPEVAALVFYAEGDTTISRSHCTITREADGSYTLMDNGSAYGSFLNRRRLDTGVPMLLHNHDDITLGDVAQRGVQLQFVLRMAKP